MGYLRVYLYYYMDCIIIYYVFLFGIYWFVSYIYLLLFKARVDRITVYYGGYAGPTIVTYSVFDGKLLPKGYTALTDIPYSPFVKPDITVLFGGLNAVKVCPLSMEYS